jgi:hypothetical protein
MGASGFQTSILSGLWSTNRASMASWATSGIVAWWTKLTNPLISSSVELWISCPAFPWFLKKKSELRVSIFHVWMFCNSLATH